MKYLECGASIFQENYRCNTCNSKIVCIANNTCLEKFDYDDWVAYCSNKGCPKHEGEGYFQELPEFMVKV